MTIVKRTIASIVLVVACLAPSAQAQSSPSASPAPPTAQPQQQDEFIPIDQLPPSEQLPAARLLIAAYSFVVAALFVYVVSVSRRLTSVRREMERLEIDMKRSGRA
jgi:CcmD family protein